MKNRGGFAMSGVSIVAALVVLAAILAIVGWYGNWFGSELPQTPPAPAATEQGGTTQSPSSSQQ